MSYQQDKLEGFDIKIDAFVNFAMNFTAVYDLIQGLVDGVNTETKKLTDWDPNKRIGTDKLQDYVNNINDQTQQNIDLVNPFGYVDDKNLIAMDEEQRTIKQVNEYMMSLPQTPNNKKEELQTLIDRTEQTSSFVPQTEQIASMKESVLQ